MKTHSFLILIGVRLVSVVMEIFKNLHGIRINNVAVHVNRWASAELVGIFRCKKQLADGGTRVNRALGRTRE